MATTAGFWLWRSSRNNALSTSTTIAFAAACIAWVLGVMTFAPVGPGMRELFQSELGETVTAVLARVKISSRPLAIDAPAALDATVWSAAVLTLWAGIARYANSRRRSLRLAWVVILTAAATAIIGALQRWTQAETILWLSSVPTTGDRPFFATFVNPNHAGTLLAAGATLSVSMWRRHTATTRWTAAVTAVICVAGVFLTGSRGALASLIAGVSTFAAISAGWRMTALWSGVAAVVAASTVAIVGVKPTRFSWMHDTVRGDVWSGRTEFWSDAVALVSASPLLGVGPGGYDMASRFAKTSPRFIIPQHAHCEPLQALVEYGVFGGVLWVAALLIPVVVAGRHYWSRRSQRRADIHAGWLAAAASVLAASLFDFPFRIGALAILIACIWGALAQATGPASPAKHPRLHRATQLAVPPLFIVGSISVLLPLREALLPESIWTEGDTQLATADEARRQARDLTLLEMDDPEPWRTQARSALRDRLRASPLDAQPLMRLGRVELEAHQPEEATRTFTAGSLAYPTLPWHWFGLARAQLASGNPAAARASWRSGLKLNLPDNDRARPWLERALSMSSTHEDWLATVPERADRLRLAAVLLAQRGEQSTADTLFAHATAQDPNSGIAWARWVLRWGDPDRALEIIAAVDHRGCDAVKIRGLVMFEAGVVQEASPWLRQALQRCGSDIELQRAALLASLELNEPGAEDALAEWLANQPTETRARRALIAHLRANQQWLDTAPHLQTLVDEGLATESERMELSRAQLGLPLP